MQISLWLFVCWGFYMTKRWAWVVFSVLVSFSVLSIIHSLLSLRMPINVLPFVSMAIGISVIWLLNVPSVRNLFKIDERNGQMIPHEMTNFSIFCLIIGLFIFVEILGISRTGNSSIPAKLFISLLGFIHLSLGFGLWKVNKTAVQAALSLLIFSALSVSIVSAYDYFELHRYLAFRKSLFYISIALMMLGYWVKRVTPKIPSQ
ncbi:MAG: hypothetical protein EHM72_11310 [Calditrichaeota bacterium]|nr:MAG: hypothetical protein EHM72_11310 [Calditrichota bacterium]